MVYGKVGGSAEPLGEIELMVGRRYVVSDRAIGTPYRRALEAVVESAGASGLPMEEVVVKVADIWSEAIWPIGMHAAAMSYAIRRIEVQKRYFVVLREPDGTWVSCHFHREGEGSAELHLSPQGGDG